MSKTPKATKFVYKQILKTKPKIKKIQSEWDLSGLFFKSPHDTKITEIVDSTERKYKQFAKKYADGTYLKTDATFLKSLTDYKKLLDSELDKVFIYLFLCREKDASNTDAEKVINLLEQRVTQFSNEVVFYSLQIGGITTIRQKKILNDSLFSEYHFLLHSIFKTAQYNLSEAEEKILSLKSITSRNLWISGTDKIINNATITVDAKEISLNGALMEMIDAPQKRREALWEAAIVKLKEIGPVAENELNALVTDKKINDKLRGYKKPYSATVQSFDITEKSLEALTEAVTTKGYTVSKKYYNLKKKIYGKKIEYIHRDDFPDRLPEVTFAGAVDICRDGFYSFNPLYGEIFDEMLQNGHIDAFPKKGKGGGAFCINATNAPTMVMLNHSSDFGSVRTLAHEMGHAIHAYRSKTQGVLYDDHSVVTAETASTFFEAVIGNTLMQQMSEKDKTVYLNALISDKIGTMIMCIARYQAELEIHETIRKEGSMTWQSMSSVLAKHFKKYCGPAVSITDNDGLSVIAKTHYRRNFYQFTYSFGVIASSIMFKRYLQNSNYKEQVDRFLSSGEKDSVENIFAEIGIDTTKKAVFLEGLDMLDSEIKELERLIKSSSS